MGRGQRFHEKAALRMMKNQAFAFGGQIMEKVQLLQCKGIIWDELRDQWKRLKD
jgi:hypothetical protein